MLRHFVTQSLPGSSKSSKRLAQELCEQTGLVYFGHVSQRDDEHHIVRGVTVSNKHKDDHYCIGTYEGYDAIFVERSDTLQSGNNHDWHIIEVDLKTENDVPHLFIGSHTNTAGFHELLKTKYHTMLPHTMGMVHSYPPDFASTFTIHVTPSHAVVAEQLIPPDVASKISAHFKGLSIEVTSDAVYIYSEKAHVTADTLTTMLSNGVWLAEQIDKNSRQLV